MLKSLYSSFSRAKLRKYCWIQPSNAYSECFQNDKENVFYKEKNNNLIHKNQHNKIVFMNKDGSVGFVDMSFQNEGNSYTSKKFKITPRITKMQMPKTVLAIHVGPSMLSWACIDSSFEVLNFDWHCWNDQLMKTNTHNLINLVSTVTPALPIAAVYVIEDVCVPRKGLKIIEKLLTQKQLATSIMSSIMLRDMLLLNSVKPADNVYILQSYFSANWFDLFIGNEVISTDCIMKELLTTNSDTNKLNISISPTLKVKYMELANAKRDQVIWSLLKAISFLCVVEEKIAKF
ncbi:uncharacterized protein LOC144471642 [Augochlora pura]